MIYVPPAIVSTDLDIVESGYFGGEFGVFLTNVPAVVVGEVDLPGSGQGSYVAHNGASIKAGGADLQLGAISPVLSNVALAIKLATLDNSVTPVAMDITATFTPPARATNQSFNFGRGAATDFVPGTSGKKITSITGMAASSPLVGGGRNQKFSVLQLPEQSDYELIVATKDVDFNTRSRMAKGIDAGMEADYWIKRGKTQPGELTIGSKLQSFVEGMMRYDGLKCTLMLVGLKDGVVTGDRLVFTEYVQTVKPRLPDGDSEAEIPSTGKFKEVFYFFAP